MATSSETSPDLPVVDDPLSDLLRDPEIRQSLAVIVANAPTLAALTTMGNALLARGPEMIDNVNSMIMQARGPLSENSGGQRLTTAVQALSDIAPLAEPLAARADVITGFLDSQILQPEIVDIIGRLGEAAMHADQATRGRKAELGGLMAAYRAFKDPEVQETLAFLVAFAEHFGASQASQASQSQPTPPAPAA